MSYPFAHGKAMTLKVLKSTDHSGLLYIVFNDHSAYHQQLLEIGRKFFCSLYGVATDNSMAMRSTSKRTTGKVVCVKSLPR